MTRPDAGQFHQGDMYWYDFGQLRGSEPGYRRPVVVIQNDLSYDCG